MQLRRMEDVKDREEEKISQLEQKLDDYNFELDLIEGPNRNKESPA